MSTVKLSVGGVSVFILKTNPPTLHIIAQGLVLSTGYTNIKLTPFIYKKEPADGIWEFEITADAPTGIVGHIAYHVPVEYDWKDFPATLKGIKIRSGKGFRIAMLSTDTKAKKPLQSPIQIINAKAWINNEAPEPTSGGTLVVNLTYNSNNHGFHGLQPAVPQGINPAILILELTDSDEMIYILNPRASSYSVGLEQADKYTSIEIRYEGRLVETIEQILPTPPQFKTDGEHVPFPLVDGERVPFPL